MAVKELNIVMVFFFFSIPIIYQTTAKVLKLPEHPSYIKTSNFYK